MYLDQFDFFANTASTQNEVDTPSPSVTPEVVTPPQYNPDAFMALALKDCSSIVVEELQKLAVLTIKN